jgi:hypothetical protein
MYESQKAIVDLNIVEARQRDIEKLEISIKELHFMFVDLALLVSTQVYTIFYLSIWLLFLKGVMIDNIEHNVSKTVDFIKEGAKDVKKSSDDHDANIKVKNFV